MDDNPDNRELLRLRLTRLGYRVTAASSGEQMLKLLEKDGPPDLVLLDLMMPGIGGMQALILMREKKEWRDVPTIVISALEASQTISEALRAGANDYVTKPISFDVLLARIETQLRMAEALATIRAQRDMLQSLALLDPLTDVYNRRAFEQRLADELSRAQRFSRPLSLIFFDLDHFKRVNDTWGHTVGDEVLREFARLLQETLRAMDVVARYGGEEFCVIMPETEGNDAFRVGERVRQRLANSRMRVNDHEICLTVSGGVAQATGRENTPQELIEKADQALYRAKQAGRNRIELYTDSSNPEKQPQHHS